MYKRQTEYKQLSNRSYNINVDLVRPTYKTDQSALRIILDNLIENATKYSEASMPVEIDLAASENHLSLAVADQGIGISDNEKSKVLDRFYRSNDENVRTQKGTGLGLYIVKRLVEELKGTMVIRDNLPRGTIVNIKLPAGDNS